MNEVGLKKAYEANQELALTLKMVSAVAFFQIDQVKRGLCQLWKNLAKSI